MQNAQFKLIVAIIGAGLWLRYSTTPHYGLIALVLPAAAWLLYRAKRNWRR